VSLNGSPLYDITHAQVLQSLNEAPKQSKLEIYRDPDYKLDSVYSPRVSYHSRASYTGSRSSLVSTDDSPQLESRKGSLTDFGSVSNRGSRRSSEVEPKLPITAKRSSEIYELSNALRHYPSQETSSPSMKRRPSSLTSYISASTLVTKRSTSSVISPLETITPKCSAESSPVTTHHSTTPVRYPINILPTASIDDDTQESVEDTAKAVSIVADKNHNIPLQALGEDQTDSNLGANEKLDETVFMEEKKLAPTVFGLRSETEPFEIEVTKGFWGLGLTVGCDKTGVIFVKALTSRSPLSKDGNVKLVTS